MTWQKTQLKFRAAGVHTVLDTISSVLSTGYLISGTKSLATGTGSFGSSAGVHAGIIDAERGTHFSAASVDRRGGYKVVVRSHLRME